MPGASSVDAPMPAQDAIPWMQFHEDKRRGKDMAKNEQETHMRCWAPPILTTTASAFPLPRVPSTYVGKSVPGRYPVHPGRYPSKIQSPRFPSARQRPTPAGLTKLSRRRHPPGNPGITDNPASLRGGQLAVSEEPHPETSADAHHAHPAILGRWARNRPSRRVQSTIWPRRRAGRGIHLAGRACFATVVGRQLAENAASTSPSSGVRPR